jgi:glycosyltransferase involved in cell wall biosynthesis
MSGFEGPISVIIPAHNEAGVIDRSLDALLKDATETERARLEVLVVCNGCTD